MRVNARSTTLSQAIAFCKERLVERILPLAALERGTGEVRRFEAGVLEVYDTASQSTQLVWDDVQAARLFLRRMPRPAWLVLESTALDAEADRLFGFTHSMACVNCLYDSSRPLPVLLPMTLVPLTAQDIPMVVQHYDVLPLDALQGAVADGRLLGGWTDGEMVGFIGLHEEGSMGMLHVFEQHRGRGYAQAIESLLINRLLAQGVRPFGQIVVGNEPSMALHRKLGFTFAAYAGSWRFR